MRNVGLVDNDTYCLNRKIVIITLVIGVVFVLVLVYYIKRCVCCAPLSCFGIGSAAKSKARRAKQQEFAMKQQQQQMQFSTPPLPRFHMPIYQQHFDGARDRDGYGYFVSASGPRETVLPVLKQPSPSYDAKKTGGGNGSKKGETSWWDKCAGY